MPGPADLLYLLMGQPDPARQIAQMLSGQLPPQPQPGQQGAGPNGPPPPTAPNGPAPAQQQNPSPGDPPPPGTAPQPQALQTPQSLAPSYQALANPPNLMNLYLQLDARTRASEGINRGLALIAANYAGNPGSARAIMESVGGGADAGGTVQNLMSLYGAQNQMAAIQSELQSAPDIAAKTGLPLAYVQSEIRAGRGSELMRGMEPPQQAKDYMWFRDQYVAAHQNDPGPDGNPIGADAARKAFEESPQGQMLALGGAGALAGMPSDTREMTIARMRFQADPANKDKPVPGYLTDETKFKIYKTDLADAKSDFNGVNQALGNFVDKLGDVSSSPKLDEITGGVAASGKGWLEGLAKGSDAYNLHTDMQGLAGYAKMLAIRGGPRGVGTNLKLLGANTDDFTNYGIGDFRDRVIAPRLVQALTAQANAYAAAGQLKQMPGYLNKYVDPMYLPGGDFDLSGGFKTTTPDKNLKQPTADDLSAFNKDLERFGPKVALKHLKDQGYDTSSLE